MSVDELAERSGFSDVSNFRKAFKKWTGRTPASYRGRATRFGGVQRSPAS